MQNNTRDYLNGLTYKNSSSSFNYKGGSFMNYHTANLKKNKIDKTIGSSQIPGLNNSNSNFLLNHLGKLGNYNRKNYSNLTKEKPKEQVKKKSSNNYNYLNYGKKEDKNNYYKKGMVNSKTMKNDYINNIEGNNYKLKNSGNSNLVNSSREDNYNKLKQKIREEENNLKNFLPKELADKINDIKEDFKNLKGDKIKEKKRKKNDSLSNIITLEEKIDIKKKNQNVIDLYNINYKSKGKTNEDIHNKIKSETLDINNNINSNINNNINNNVDDNPNDNILNKTSRTDKSDLKNKETKQQLLNSVNPIIEKGKILIKDNQDNDNSTDNYKISKNIKYEKDYEILKNKKYNNYNDYNYKYSDKISNNNNLVDDSNNANNFNNFSYSSDVKKVVENLNGLQNLGNTCFMNTCLQSLIHCPNFIQRFFSFYPNFSSNNSTTISDSFYKLCKEQGNSSMAGCPSDFKSSFGYKHSEFRGYSQHDTQEFCRFILEDISKELNKVKKIPKYKEIDDKNKNKLEIDEEYTKLFRAREDSIVVDTFYAKIINIFTCKCGFESYSFQMVLDLPLLPRSSSGENLTDLIDEYFENDQIEWGTKCEKCGKKTVHEKNMKMAYAPEILILSLQRYNMRRGSKNTESIRFKEYMDLSKFVDKDCNKNNSAKYKLISIGNHSGTINFGHYYAYVNINNKWHEFNDSHCFPLGSISESSSTAYVLFYQRQ